VLAVCRSWFKLPPDSSTLQVVLADAAQEIKKTEWQGTVDALAVDLYDHEAAAPVLDSAEFYADCRNLLTEDGIMTVNLFGRSSSFDKSLDQMAQAFGEDALWAFRPTREGNTVVLAQRTPRVLQGAELDLACDQVQARWDLNTTRWARGVRAGPRCRGRQQDGQIQGCPNRPGCSRMIAKYTRVLEVASGQPMEE
jgi:spermidine synthase